MRLLGVCAIAALATTTGSHERLHVRRSTPLTRLRGGSDQGQSAEAVLHFTRGCLVGVESKKTLAGAFLPLFRTVIRYFGHWWVDEPTVSESRSALVSNLPVLRGGVSKLVAKYATNTSVIPKLVVDNSTDGSGATPRESKAKAAAARDDDDEDGDEDEEEDEDDEEEPVVKKSPPVKAKAAATSATKVKPAAKPATKPAAKPAASATAPKPKAALPKGGKVIAITSGKHLSEILGAAPPTMLVVLDFTATWCGPCQQIAPVFARLATELPHVLFLKVDADSHGPILQKYGVKAFPTFVLLKRRAELSRMQGADAGALEAAVRANAGKPDPWATAKKSTGRTLR